VDRAQLLVLSWLGLSAAFSCWSGCFFGLIVCSF
jgi:hypothetical protein